MQLPLRKRSSRPFSQHLRPENASHERLSVIYSLRGVLMIIAIFSNSVPIVTPFFPGKGEMTEFSIAFSSDPDAAILRSDDDNGLVSSYAMRKKGTFNGAVLYSASAPVTTCEGLFHFYFAFISDGVSWYYSKAGITRNVPKLSDNQAAFLRTEAPYNRDDWSCGQTPRFFRRQTAWQ